MEDIPEGELLDAAPDAIVVVDAMGTMVLVNLQTERIFGYGRAELLGKPVELLVPPRYRAAHPDHRASFFRDPRTRAMGDGLDLWGIRKDGTEFPAEISLSRVESRNGMLVCAAIRDITDRKRVEAEAARLSRMLADAEKATGRGSWEWDVQTGEMSWSKGMYGILGVDVESFDKSTEHFLALIHADDRDRVSAAFAKALSDPGPFYEEYRLIRPDGATRYFRHEADVIPDPLGKPRILHGVIEDITERSQDARDETLRLETINELRTRLMNMIAHELNNPLTPLKIQLHLLSTDLSYGLTGQQRDSVAIARAMTERIVGFLADLLEMARVDSGTLSIKPKPYDLAAQARTLVAQMDVGLSGPKSGVDVAAPQEAIVVADSRRIEQVLVNLLSNALKFSEPDGRVELSVEVRDEDVQVNVRGGGRGIQAEDIPKLFQPFVQVGGKDQKKHSGTGLGLYICKAIIEQHGGRIWCESQGLGKGATFSFTLPGHRAPASNGSLPAQPGPG